MDAPRKILFCSLWMPPKLNIGSELSLFFVYYEGKFFSVGSELSLDPKKKALGASTNNRKEFSLGIHKFTGIFHTVVTIDDEVIDMQYRP